MKNLLGHEVGSGDVPPIGAAIVGRHAPELLAIDEDAGLWTLAAGDRKDLVRWCLQRGVRVYPTLAHLVHDLNRGLCTGLLSRFARSVGWPRHAGDIDRACDFPARDGRIAPSTMTGR